MNTLEKLNLNLHSLVIFRSLLKDKVLQKLSKLLSCSKDTPVEQIDCYSSFTSQLFNENENFTDFLLNHILEDENIYILKRTQNLPVDKVMQECLQNELKVLEEISQLTSKQVRDCLVYDGYLPSWKNSTIDFTSEYMNRVDNIYSYGYGIFAKYTMFNIKDSVITPVKSPDTTKFSDLKGYEMERKAVIDNTTALLKGKPAANVLLYGDAGTGKSSTVKAVVNEFKDQGLRLIEITKKQFRNIPTILDSLSKNPLKFILFIDDLSFTKDDDDFGALKAILEGSASAKTPNLVIYATSNRRHFVKESFSDRDDDDIHLNDTIQELASLSDRFGLSVSFFKPDKAQYLDIVHELSEQYEINMCIEDLDLEAERYALRHSGRSPRVARQFMEYLKATEE